MTLLQGGEVVVVERGALDVELDDAVVAREQRVAGCVRGDERLLEVQAVAQVVGAGERAVGRQTGSITNLVDIGNAHGDRRFSQGTIRAGDEVYLLGYARPRDGDERERAADDPVSVRLRPGSTVVTPPPEGEDGAFIVSERDEQRLLSESRWGRAVLVAGLFAVVVGLALVVSPTTLLA